jgi:hypothetical protein
VVIAPADGSAVCNIEQLAEALSKENFNGFRTSEFDVVILTWLLWWPRSFGIATSVRWLCHWRY